MKFPAMTLHLYRHDRDGLFDEVHGGGYAPLSLSPDQWVMGQAEAHYPGQSFAFTKAIGWVRGWYIRHDGKSVAHGPLSPIEIKSPGDKISVNVRIELPAFM